MRGTGGGAVYDEEFVRTLNNGIPISSRSKSDQNLSSSHNDLMSSSQAILPHKSTLTLAEKKRIQWQQEKGF